MKNILKIFFRDLGNLVKHPIAFSIILGLCVLPSLYAWFNIFANWDPYANTGGVPVAVVSVDQDYVLRDGTVANMGASVVENLHSNTSVDWHFVESEAEALSGVQSGEYYAGIVITEKFTYSMYHVFDEDFVNPSVIYYQNQKSNAIATKITDTVASTLQNTINKTFIEVVVSTIFEGGNRVSEDIEDGDYVMTLKEKVDRLNNNLIAYCNMMETFEAGNDKLDAAISHVNYEIPLVKKRTDATVSSLQESNKSLANTRTVLTNFSNHVDSSMSNINNSLENMKRYLDQSTLPQDSAQMVRCLQQVAIDGNGLNKEINQLMNELIQQKGNQEEPTVSGSDAGQTDVSGGDVSGGNVIGTIFPDIKDRLPKNENNDVALNGAIQTLQAMQKELALLNKVAGSVLESSGERSAEKAEETVRDSFHTVENAIGSCQNSVTNMQNIYRTNLVPQMQTILTNMSDSLGQVTNLMETLGETMDSVSVMMGGVREAVNGTSESVEQVEEVVEKISTKLTELSEMLEGAEEDEVTDIVIRFLGGDPETFGEYFSEPVAVETVALYPVATYGSAMTPFYTTLAIWVGSTILVAIVKVKASPKGLENVQSYQLYVGRYVLFFLLAQIQAAIIVAGDLWLLKVNIVEPKLFFLAASFAATAFSMLIYSLTLAFGDVGKAVCVIVMVLQIAGSSGTFPIELLPETYQKIYIFFPFPYAIAAMREALAGMYGTAYMEALGKLLIFIIAGLMIGLVIRIPFVRLNHFVEERMEDTEMM